MKKSIHSHKKGKSVTISATISLRQHEFIKEHKLNPDRLLRNAIKMEKQRISQELQQMRKKKFNNEFKKINPRIDEYVAEKRKGDHLWSLRYKHARAVTMSKFIRYGGPVGDKLFDKFVNNYEILLKENEKPFEREKEQIL
jgi:hypothetical protein